MDRPAPCDAGTTLIELLLVTVLLGVLGTLGTTVLTEYRLATDQRSLAQEAVSLVRSASSQAVARSTPYCVRFSAEAATAYRGACGTGTVTGRLAAPGRSRFTGASFGGSADVLLRPRGTSSGGSVSVVRGDGTGRSLVVRVEALTSRVSYA